MASYASRNETTVEPELGKKPSFFSTKVKTAVSRLRLNKGLRLHQNFRGDPGASDAPLELAPLI